MIDRPPVRRALAVVLALALGAACALPARAAGTAATAAYGEVLARVRAVRAHGRTPVVVFGLDGTLLDPAARTRDILTRALDGPGAVVSPEQPQLAERVQSLPLARYADAPETTLARAGIVDTAMVRALVVRWRQDFPTNRFLLDDEALPGAVPYVNALHAAGATVVYRSRRDARHMLGGTAQALLERGFPVGIARTQLLLKPDRGTDDAAFARESLDAVAALGEVVAVFDSAPAVVDEERARFPEALAFLLGRADSGGVPVAPAPRAGVTRADDFASFVP